MKKSILNNIFIWSIMFFISCNSLELSPEDYYASNNFWKNKAQVEGSMLGLHADFRDMYSANYLLGEARGGTSKNGTSTLATSLDYSSPIKDNSLTKDKTGISNWHGYYAKILQVNLFISKVENECPFLDASDRSYYLGQAYGIRAYYYFMLYRTYGGVPLITEVKVINGVTNAKDLYTPRSSAKQTLDFIKQDVKKSVDLFGNDISIKGNKAQWSKAASLVLTGEIYLWSAKVKTNDQIPATTDLQMAKTALEQLIGKFRLQDNFSDLFDVKKKGNDELIMVYRFVEGESTNWASNFLYADAVFIGQVYGRDRKLIAHDTLNLKSTGILRNEYKFGFYESFDDNDTRKASTFFDFYKHDANGNINEKGVLMIKALGIINALGSKVYNNDIPLYRYSDVLLMLAEIENKLNNDPSFYINEVRKRAFGKNYNINYEYTNKGFVINELTILYERDKEFVWEGKRWFDVCRMQDGNGQALVFDPQVNYDSNLSILDKNKESHMLLWPVDVNTLNNDPTLDQTQGY